MYTVYSRVNFLKSVLSSLKKITDFILQVQPLGVYAQVLFVIGSNKVSRSIK